jgi:hypothetical protein
MNGKRRPKWAIALLAFVLLYIVCSLASCIQSTPYRKADTSDPQKACSITLATNSKLGLDVGADLDQIVAAQVQSDCQAQQIQSVRGLGADNETLFEYDTLFLELDDQGLLNTMGVSDASTYSAWNDEKNQLAAIRTYLKSHDNERLFILTYVHGWKHNASFDDPNVIEFHRTLRKLKYSLANCAKPCSSAVKNARVVGIYVGWRGDSLSGPDLWKDTTFYERKAAAERVAGGAIRELFSLLHAYEQKRNSEQIAGYSTGPDPYAEKTLTAPCVYKDTGSHCQVTTMILGHSFGGLITFEALQGAYVDALTRASIEQKPCVEPESSEASVDAGPCANVLDSPADLVVLINPAIEATRFAPIVRLIASMYHQGFRFDRPALALLTSTADTATSVWFPVGRALGTTLESTLNPEEREANLRTAGHMSAYVTHYLDNVENENFATPENANCRANGVTRGSGSRCFYECPENANKLNFLLDDTWNNTGLNIFTCPRVSIFKGADLQTGDLKVEAFALPIWNIKSTSAIMSGHSDFEQGKLDVAVASLMIQADLLPWPLPRGGSNQ